MTDRLVVDQGTVRGIGTRLTSLAQGMTTEWHAGADCGDAGVRSSLDALMSAVGSGLFGAAAEVFSLGQSSIDAADVYAQTDHSL